MKLRNVSRLFVRLAAGGVLALSLHGCASQWAEHRDPDPILQAFRDAVARGEQAHNEQRHGEAATAYLRAHALDPANHVISARVADELLAAGDTNGALENYQLALRTDPEFAPALEGAGVILVRMKRYDDAQPMLARAVNLLPSSWKAHSALGIAADAHRQFDLAATHHQQAIELNPQDPALHGNLGFSFYLAGKFDAAVESLWAALWIDPKNERAWRHMAMVRMKQDEVPSALQALREIESLPAAFNDLGCFAMQMGDSATATHFFNRAIEAAPGGYAPASDNLLALARSDRVRVAK